jgi:hypothetical protein
VGGRADARGTPAHDRRPLLGALTTPLPHPTPAPPPTPPHPQVEFEAPKDYKEPQRAPPKPAAPAAPAADAPGAAGAAEAPAEEEDEGPKFVAFVGQGRRLDGKAASSGPAPAGNPAAAAAAARAAAAAKAGGGASGSGRPGSSGGDGGGGGGGAPRSKAGTFVSTGNRLLDKLQREKVRSGGGSTSHKGRGFGRG